MGIAAFLVVLVIAIAILITLLVKFKFHPLMALFLTSVFLGIAMGNDVVKTMGLINTNFGGTLSGIGITIIFGAIIAMGIQDTGAVRSITNFFIRLFNGKRMELAPSLSTFIMSIPVFGDISIVLVAPLAAVLAKRKKASMTLTAMMTVLASSMTHGLVPPTPGILAVSIMLGADVGLVVVWGIVASAVAMALTYLFFRKYCLRSEYIAPLANFTEGIDEAGENAAAGELLMDQSNCPSAVMAFLPLLVPMVFISAGTFANMLLPKDSSLLGLCNIMADRGVALFAGVVCVIWVGYKNRNFVIRNSLVNSHKVKATASEAEFAAEAAKTGYFGVCFGNWVSRALVVALTPLLVTAMGGALGGILRSYPKIGEMGEVIASSGIHGAFVPFIMAGILMTICGSQTMASMTTAGIVVNMIPALGITPVVCALAIGAGSMVGWQLNNSGFWVGCEFFGLSARQGLKYYTLPAAFCGLFAFLVLVAGSVAKIV